MAKWIHSLDGEIYKSTFASGGNDSHLLILQAFNQVKKNIILWLFEKDPELLKEIGSHHSFFESYIIDHCFRRYFSGNKETLTLFYELSSSKEASKELLSKLLPILLIPSLPSYEILELTLYLFKKNYIPSSWCNVFLSLPEHVLKYFSPEIGRAHV